MHLRICRSKKTINSILLYMVAINILIPKSGIKLNGIPLTLGSLCLLIFLIKNFVVNRKISKFCAFIMFSSLFWFVVISFGIISNGTSTGNTFYTVSRIFSYFVSLSVCPLIVIGMEKEIKDTEQADYLLNIIRYCVLSVLIYGCLQYFLGVGSIQIPGITVNLSDFLLNPNGWWKLKANAVYKDNTKIISTYQNGNLFGANMLLLFPIVDTYFSRKKLSHFVDLLLFGFCALVSGSRTFVFGFLFYIMLLLIELIRERRINKKYIYLGGAFVVIVVVAIYQLTMSNNAYFIRFINALNWDSILNASNRTVKFQNYLEWLSESGNLFTRIMRITLGSFGVNHNGEAYEMLWGGIFIFGGLFGLIIFYIPILKTLLLLKKNDEVLMLKSFFKGLCVYMFASFVEGAFWLLPTAINFWMIVGLSRRMVGLNKMNTVLNEFTDVI